MPKFGVPVWIRLEGFVVIDADSLSEAKQLIKEGHGELVADGSNWTSLDNFDGFRFEHEGDKVYGRKLTDDEADEYDSWDNDKGVPW